MKVKVYSVALQRPVSNPAGRKTDQVSCIVHRSRAPSAVMDTDMHSKGQRTLKQEHRRAGAIYARRYCSSNTTGPKGKL